MATPFWPGRRRDRVSMSLEERAALAKAPKRQRRDVDVRDVAGKIWTSPNTALGLAYGLTGYLAGQAYRLKPGDQPDPRVKIRNNVIEFINNPFGGIGAITLGNTITYSNDPYTDYVDAPMEGLKFREHERQHTLQAQQLGPFYLPSNVLGGLYGLVRDRQWHGPSNWNEQGPAGEPPTPWARRKP